MNLKKKLRKLRGSALVLLSLYVGAFSESVSAQSLDGVEEWAVEAVADVMTFDFTDIENHFSEANKYFTQTGYPKFMEALWESKIPENVKQSRMLVHFKRTCIPQLEDTVRKGHRFEVRFPGNVTYQAGSKFKTNHLEFLIVGEELDGKFLIEQWIVTSTDAEKVRICSKKGRIQAEIESLKSEIHEREKSIKKLELKLEEK